MIGGMHVPGILAAHQRVLPGGARLTGKLAAQSGRTA
jgi:hypothetical protein